MSGLIFWGIIFSVRAHYLDILDLRFSLFILSVPSIHIVHSLFPERSRLGLRPQPMRSPQTRWSPKRVKRQPAVPIGGIKTSDPTSFFFSRKRATSDAAQSICYSAWSRPSACYSTLRLILYGLFLPARRSLRTCVGLLFLSRPSRNFPFASPLRRLARRPLKRYLTSLKISTTRSHLRKLIFDHNDRHYRKRPRAGEQREHRPRHRGHRTEGNHREA